MKPTLPILAAAFLVVAGILAAIIPVEMPQGITETGAIVLAPTNFIVIGTNDNWITISNNRILIETNRLKNYSLIIGVTNSMKNVWSEEAPKQEGWYWMLDGGTVDVVRVKYQRAWGGRLCCRNAAAYGPVECWPNVLWCGPIPEPREP